MSDEIETADESCPSASLEICSPDGYKLTFEYPLVTATGQKVDAADLHEIFADLNERIRDQVLRTSDKMLECTPGHTETLVLGNETELRPDNAPEEVPEPPQ